MDTLIARPRLMRRISRSLERSRITALLGPRQCGKTTLARQLTSVSQGKVTWFDLEDPRDARALEQPMTVLEGLRGLLVIDEIQRQPSLFPILRVLADRAQAPASFLILGSAAPELMQQASESLAGRVEFVEVGGFSAWEAKKPARLWLRGGLPRSFLAAGHDNSMAWRESFIQAFLERDLGLLDDRMAPALMRRFWTMLAHYHGQTFNASALSAALGMSQKAVRHYLDLLTGTYMVRQLQPWFVNVGKRLVKTPKLYLRDSGILHSLLGIETRAALDSHPQVGASWEGFALEQTLRLFKGDPYFWATHNGAEVDLVLHRRQLTWGFEFKRADAPALTRSMRVGLSDLKLDHLWVIYPGPKRYDLDDRVTVVPLRELAKLQAS